MLNQISFLALMSVLIGSLVPFALAAGPGSSTLNIFPPNSSPYGLSYSEHIKNYWRWLIGIPGAINPVTDRTGGNCAVDQLSSTNSSVFYLASTPGGDLFSSAQRICEVPAGKGLFIPVTQVEISPKESPTITTDEGLEKEAKNDQDGVTSMSLTIDGRKYTPEELAKYRTQTGPFDVYFKGPNPLYGVDEGPSRSAADGHYIITEPLTKGNHTIQFDNSYDPNKINLAQDVTYKIIAK